LQQYHGDQRGGQLCDARDFRFLPEVAAGQQAERQHSKQRAPPFLIESGQRVFMDIMQKGQNPHQPDTYHADAG